MKKNIIPKLNEILEYYRDVYGATNIDEVFDDLVNNNVEVQGDSFYCPVWNDTVSGWILLAGTKDKADLWVLKKIIRLIKSGDKIITMFNGNSDYLLKQFARYNVKVINRDNDISIISFN